MFQHICFQARAYFKFLLNSKTKYSVHSPFVYGLITQCLEKPHGFKQLEPKAQLERIKDYHHHKVSDLDQPIELKIARGDEDIETIFAFVDASPNGSLIMFPKPHQNKKNEEMWRHLTQNSHLNVSIDLFSVGLLFKRPHQVEEHFSLRLL